VITGPVRNRPKIACDVVIIENYALRKETHGVTGLNLKIARRKGAGEKGQRLWDAHDLCRSGNIHRAGWWLPLNVPLRNYVPIPTTGSTYLAMVPLLPIQLAVGVIVFILLQFVVVLISGILFPLPPRSCMTRTDSIWGRINDDLILSANPSLALTL